MTYYNIDKLIFLFLYVLFNIFVAGNELMSLKCVEVVQILIMISILKNCLKRLLRVSFNLFMR